MTLDKTIPIVDAKRIAWCKHKLRMEVKNAPSTLSFGMYRVECHRDTIRYYVLKKVKNEPHSIEINSTLALGGLTNQTLWSSNREYIFYDKQGKEIARGNSPCSYETWEEVEVSRDEWISVN